MSNLSQEIILPSVSDALVAVRSFAEIDPETVRDYTTLADRLGGMSLALSAIAHANETNPRIGIWTEIGEDADRHKFTAIPQDILGLSGVHIERYAVDGGTDKYYDSVNVPTERVLKDLLATNPRELHNGWDLPGHTDIYAVRVRTSNEGQRTSEDYWPFHLPVTRPADALRTAEQDAVDYTRVLSELSRTLLEVVER